MMVKALRSRGCSPRSEGDRTGLAGEGPVRVLAEYYRVRRWTFPAFRHAVQTLSFTGRPSTVAFTGWMFGRNIRAERPSTRRLWALRPSRATWLPKLGSLPHTSQRFDISILLEKLAMACRPPIAMSIEKGEMPLRKRWSTAWETRAGLSAQRREIDRCRLPDEVSRPMPSLEHAADRNGMPQSVQVVYDSPA
jgi:hypothetical protein